MSATLKVITNSLGSNNYCIVYETNCGEIVFEGHSVSPTALYHILRSTNGMCEEVRLCQLTDEQMENWQEHT